MTLKGALEKWYMFWPLSKSQQEHANNIITILVEHNRQLREALQFYRGDENEGYAAWIKRMTNDLGAEADKTLAATDPAKVRLL